jgi:Transposase DDE domain
LKTDFGGLPLAFHLTGGEASDSRNFETLLDIGPDINSRAALGDKGYDSKSNRQAARQRGICPAIPYRSNTKDMPALFFQEFFTRAALTSSNQSASSNDSNASHCAARRQLEITVPSWLSHSASS